jgi:prevent-host-death family protein
MAATVTALEAKTRFGKLLDRVSRGEEIIVTRHERPVARMVPADRSSLNHVRAAVTGLRKLRAEIARRQGAEPPLTDAQVKSLIEAGRR